MGLIHYIYRLGMGFIECNIHAGEPVTREIGLNMITKDVLRFL